VCVVTTVTMIILLRDFGPYGVIFMMCVCCYNRYHDNAVKGFWALWSNIYDVCVVTTVTMIMLLRDFGPYGVIFMMCVLLQPLPW
jgi:hypothetical protein